MTTTNHGFNSGFAITVPNDGTSLGAIKDIHENDPVSTGEASVVGLTAGNRYRFRKIKAGANIVVEQESGDVVISAPNVGAIDTLGELTDVKDDVTTSAVDEQFLKFKAGEWINGNVTLGECQDVDFPTSLADNQVLTYNIVSNHWENKDLPPIPTVLNDLTDVQAVASDNFIVKYNATNSRWESENDTIRNKVDYSSVGGTQLSILNTKGTLITSNDGTGNFKEDYFPVMSSVHFQKITNGTGPYPTRIEVNENYTAYVTSIIFPVVDKKGERQKSFYESLGIGDIIAICIHDVSPVIDKIHRSLFRITAPLTYDGTSGGHYTATVEFINDGVIEYFGPFDGNEYLCSVELVSVPSKIRINDLRDVVVSTPADNQVLTYISGNWINQTPTAVVSKVSVVMNLTDIQGPTTTPTIDVWYPLPEPNGVNSVDGEPAGGKITMNAVLGQPTNLQALLSSYKAIIRLTVESYSPDESDVPTEFAVALNGTVLPFSILTNYSKNSITHPEGSSTSESVVALAPNDILTIWARRREEPTNPFGTYGVNVPRVSLAVIEV